MLGVGWGIVVKVILIRHNDLPHWIGLYFLNHFKSDDKS